MTGELSKGLAPYFLLTFSSYLFFINEPPCRSCRDWHSFFSLDEKKEEKNQAGRHLDTPSKTVPKGTGFEGGQGSFLSAGQRHRKTALFPRVTIFAIFTPRLFTREERLLIDAAISRLRSGNLPLNNTGGTWRTGRPPFPEPYRRWRQSPPPPWQYTGRWCPYPLCSGPGW